MGYILADAIMGLRTPDIPPQAKTVWAWMGKFADKNNECAWKQAEIAKYIGYYDWHPVGTAQRILIAKRCIIPFDDKGKPMTLEDLYPPTKIKEQEKLNPRAVKFLVLPRPNDEMGAKYFSGVKCTREGGEDGECVSGVKCTREGGEDGECVSGVKCTREGGAPSDTENASLVQNAPLSGVKCTVYKSSRGAVIPGMDVEKPTTVEKPKDIRPRNSSHTSPHPSTTYDGQPTEAHTNKKKKQTAHCSTKPPTKEALAAQAVASHMANIAKRDALRVLMAKGYSLEEIKAALVGFADAFKVAVKSAVKVYTRKPYYQTSKGQITHLTNLLDTELTTRIRESRAATELPLAENF